MEHRRGALSKEQEEEATHEDAEGASRHHRRLPIAVLKDVIAGQDGASEHKVDYLLSKDVASGRIAAPETHDGTSGDADTTQAN